MTKKMLLQKIKTYEGNIERHLKHAKRYYAEYKETGSQQAYIYSQGHYREAERCKEVLNTYNQMLANRQYTDN